MKKRFDPEEWEREYWIVENERWDDLVELRKEEVEEHDSDEDSLLRLADALILAKRHEEAFNILSRLHKENPKENDINNLILKILKDTGKKEDEFNWKETPKILRLDEDLFQFCLGILKKKRKKNRTLYEIQEALVMKNIFMDFSNKELAEWLKKDNRLKFKEEDDDEYTSSIIEILKTKKSK